MKKKFSLENFKITHQELEDCYDSKYKRYYLKIYRDVMETRMYDTKTLNWEEMAEKYGEDVYTIQRNYVIGGSIMMVGNARGEGMFVGDYFKKLGERKLYTNSDKLVIQRPSLKTKQEAILAMTETQKQLASQWRQAQERQRRHKDKKYYELVTITLKNDREEYNRLIKERKAEQSKIRAAEKRSTKPKARRSAWICYSMAQRPLIKEKNPDMTMIEITKVMAKKWKKESDKVKQKYEKKAQKDAERWESEMKVWKKTKNATRDESTSSS